tara:strand:- start:1557 stop:1895 length:339 start_codon:yes stop_codon:yes gene_type:complete
MKTILEITNQTTKERNDMLLEAFFFWAGKFTTTKTQYQIVICSKPIQNWFFTEYAKLENEFIVFVNRHSGGSVKEDNTLYNRMMLKIYSIYPKVLLDDIKKKYNGIPMHNLN